MPYLGSTFFVGALVVLFFAGATAYFLLVLALAPGFIERTSTVARTRPVASFSIGLFAMFAGVLAVAVLLNAAAGPARLFGVIGLALAVGFVLAGLAGVARQIGLSLTPEGSTPSAVVARGSVVLLFAAALPIVGWVLVAPLALIVGTGAACMSLRRAPKPAPIPVLAAVPMSAPSGWAR